VVIRSLLAVLAAMTVFAVCAPRADAQSSPAPRQSGNIERISPDWLTFDREAKTTRMEIVAGLTTANSAWNFNGYANGDMTIAVPLGWEVTIRFRNRDANVPHSVGIVEIEDPMPVSGDETTMAFPRAFSLSFSRGISSQREDTFSFTASKTGRFWLFCGVPPHGRAGMWDYFVVSDEIAEPYVEVVKKEG
jgi:sulfocyanin